MSVHPLCSLFKNHQTLYLYQHTKYSISSFLIFIIFIFKKKKIYLDIFVNSPQPFRLVAIKLL
jgi:penicillin-binding protein-related factor A (putative recombinase)